MGDYLLYRLLLVAVYALT